MKKRFISLLLALTLLLSVPAYAAGSAGDPIISQSYIDGTFIPEMISAVNAAINEAISEFLAALEQEDDGDSPSGMATLLIAPGGSLELSTGQSIILLSGSARLEILSGSVVNATVGYEAASGALNTAHRYIVCEDSAARVNILSDSTVYVSASAAVTPGDGRVSPFADVQRGAWYFDDVLSAYERGLVNGMSATSYQPGGNLTVAQAIKLAACMHQLYHEGQVTLKNSESGGWYLSYLDYALQKGIISDSFDGYDGAATRQTFIEIFFNALPESEYAAINAIPDGSIGDIGTASPWEQMVYTFYRAGILTGYTADSAHNTHDFGPHTTISRAEVATIMNRMFDHSARQTFTIE